MPPVDEPTGESQTESNQSLPQGEQAPTALDRAAEKEVDVPQNEAPVVDGGFPQTEEQPATDDRPADATPTDAGTVPGSDTPPPATTP